MSYIELDVINKKIEETETALQNWHNSDNSLIGTMMIEQLSNRLSQLNNEKESLLKSQAKETIFLRIHGEKIQTGRVSSRILISALNGFQQMSDSIANAINNSSSKRGKVPEAIKDITDFQVVGTFAGSFGIVLEKEHEQYDILSESAKLNIVLDKVFSILETVDDSEMLLSAIAPFGQRTVKHYREWLDNLSSNEANLELTWKDESARYRCFDINRENSSRIISTLDTIDRIENDDIILTGILNGVNIRNHTFEMNVEGIGIIKGTALIETLIAISDKIGKEINATLIRSTSLTKSNVEKITWYLSEAT